MRLVVQYRFVRDRLILGALGIIVFVNVFNYFIMNPPNVDSLIENPNSSIK